jgi:hypothetical protein
MEKNIQGGKIKQSIKRPRNKTGNNIEKGDLCFVIMPFGGWYDEYFENIYSPAITSCKLIPKRTDDLYQSSNIVQDIWKFTNKAKIILADLSNKNPNVFYELGLAHALTKPAILISENIEDIPFDLRNMRILTYDKNIPDWGSILKKSIEKAIKESMISPLESVPAPFIKIEKSEPKQLSKQDKTIVSMKQDIELLKRRLYSRSNNENISSSMLSLEQARNMIRNYMNSGLSVEMIVDSLSNNLNVPKDWVISEISKYKNSRLIRSL